MENMIAFTNSFVMETGIIPNSFTTGALTGRLSADVEGRFPFAGHHRVRDLAETHWMRFVYVNEHLTALEIPQLYGSVHVGREQLFAIPTELSGLATRRLSRQDFAFTAGYAENEDLSAVTARQQDMGSSMPEEPGHVAHGVLPDFSQDRTFVVLFTDLEDKQIAG